MNKTASVVAVACMTALASSAALIVDFTRDSGLSAVHSRPADDGSATSVVWDFSDTVALVNDTETQNGKIYGGMQATWASGTATINNRFNLARYEFQVNPSSAVQASGMLVWNKEDFLAGSDSQLGFGAGDSLTFNIVTMTAQATGNQMRFVVKQGGNYYASSSVKTDNAPGSFSAMDAAGEEWALIDTADYSLGTFGSMAVTDIEAVGLYFNASGNANQFRFYLDDFQANATVIPEPAALGLVALASGGLVMLRRMSAI